MLKTLLAGLFPVKCLICKIEGSWLCCDLPPAPPNSVKFKHLDEIHSVTDYKTAKPIIEALKFKGLKSITPIISKQIYQSCPKDFWQSKIVTPIPLHWQRQMWRGFNQSALIIPPNITQNKVLKRVKKTQQQARLDKSDRFINLKQAFICTDSVANQDIILVDDVSTSGQTLEEAARTLKQAGARKVIGVTFAR